MLTHARREAARDERGQVIIMFALLVPVFLALGGFVIGIGNWYTHGKHLQTKADAGALASGLDWQFPCEPTIDAKIEATARAYAGAANPQIGGVPNANVHTVLNGTAWYDDDSNPAPVERNDPLNASVCNAMILDVKVTEDNSFPLFSLIPLFPDIKRKARIEVQQVEGISGLLPIAVRAPEPVSAAAVFYNESTGNILATKYFVKAPSIFGMPGGLQGWSSFNGADAANTWANFTPPARAGVAIAISFRGACNTTAPPGVVTTAAPCFEDTGFTTVNQLCNQGSVQIINCYYATGTYPTEAVQSGLHFIRGYGSGNVANAPPQVRSAYLENISCQVLGQGGTGYFNVHPANDCQARVHVAVELGSVVENPPPNPPNTTLETRIASNVQVRYGIKRADGSTFCPNIGNNCDLIPSAPNAQGTVTYSSSGTNASPHALLTANSMGNAIAVEIQVRRSTVVPNPGSCSNDPNMNFSNNCRWFHIGTGISSTSVNPITNASGAAVLNSPITRAFRGNSNISSSIQWLRLTRDTGCSDGVPDFIDQEAASAPSTGNHCFFVDMGLKGGIAQDADEEPILFNDGTGSSQMGALDCDPNIPQGQILIDGVIQGCSPLYAKNLFFTNPLCPAPNALFTTPNPGAPFDSTYPWPPIRCIKTRPTGSMNQLERGFDNRLFGSNNAPCPPDGPGYVRGRNYWNAANNPGNLGVFGYKDNDPVARATNFSPADKRIVTIFLAPTEAFTSSGQNTYPITGFIEVYVTGYGRINGSGNLTIDDPCPGSTPPSDIECHGSGCGYAIWGHILKYAVPSPSATPSGVRCNPALLDPCVPVLVE